LISPGLSKRAYVALTVTFLVVASLSIVATQAISGDDLQLLINSWLSGKPKAMDKLVITVPNAPQVSYCYVAVRRLPTPMEPTADGFSELLYFGKVGGGGTIVVRHVFNAVPVKYGVDKSGETYVKYYEPKDYVVSVLCVGSDGKPLHNYSYVRFVEVVPRKVMNVAYVRWVRGAGKPAPSSLTPGAGGGSDYVTSCRITITKVGRDPEGPYKEGYCDVWLAFTYVNSVPGLKVAMGFPRYPPTGIYFTAFSRHDDIISPGAWEVSGERIARSIISGTTHYASDGGRELVLVKVRYKYEYHEIDGPDGGYIADTQLLYPSVIRGIDDVPAGQYVEPSTHPTYATHLRKGYDISFGLGGTKVTDEVTGVSTSVTVELGPASFTLTVNVYRAVRSDQEYSPPYVKIVDYSGEGYWWWFKNDDPTTYSVLLERG